MALLLLLLSGGVPSALAQDSQANRLELEIAVWNAIRHDKDPSSFEAYLEEFPNGLFRELAVNRLSAFKPGTPPLGIDDVTPLSPMMMDKEAYSRLERAFWDAIQDSTDVKDYSVYLGKFPDGVFKPLAIARRNALQH